VNTLLLHGMKLTRQLEAKGRSPLASFFSVIGGTRMASVEVIKRQGLAGEIAGTLAQDGERFSKDDTQRLKHFGIYQQAEGNLVRLKIPGGRFSTAQYVAVSDIALRYANRQFMLTTRQDVQLHTVRPQHLWRCRPQCHDLSGQ
jgi:sulfite reductase beta subunit-like hemoprotein